MDSDEQNLKIAIIRRGVLSAQGVLAMVGGAAAVAWAVLSDAGLSALGFGLGALLVGWLFWTMNKRVNVGSGST